MNEVPPTPKGPRDSPVDVDGDVLFEQERTSLGTDPKTLCGIALSGGGIRSATFNLGVIQALEKQGLLGGFHYLSTVSGGGYIGGFWSAWRRQRATKTAASQAPTDSSTFPHARSREIKHLRRFSNFLRPRLPLISFETGRMVSAVLTALIPSLAATLGVLVMVLLLGLGAMWLVTELPQPWATGVFAALLLCGHGLFWRLWHGISAHENQATNEPKLAGPRLLWQLIATGTSAALWWLGWWLVPLPTAVRITPTSAAGLLEGHWLAAFLPPVAILVGVFVLVLLRTLTSRLRRDLASRKRWQGTLDTALAASLYMALGATVLGVLWVAGPWLAADGVKGILAALSVSGVGGGAFAWLRKLLVRQPNKPEAGKVRAAAGPWLLQVLAYVVVAAAMLAAAALLSTLFGALGLTGLIVAMVGGILLCLLPLAFDPEADGLHNFYRSRLARAYLGAATPSDSHESEEAADDDFLLSDVPPGRPLHLICCAANDLAGDPIPSLHRGAESAVLSRLGIQVGTYWARWTDKRTPSFGSAMTASAAAFNSHMGAKSMRFGQAVTFLLTALNLRLGLWVGNPKHTVEKKKNDPRASSWWLLPPFYREMFGQSNLLAPSAFLSDGAHYDNLALYELVRRGCRFIVLCDCGADPDYAFDDLGNAIRRIRTDFGVEIALDTAPLRPSAERRSPQSIVAGQIRYGTEAPGVILLVKPALQGDEPADVRQYAERSPDFPQQTTLDQFYDEAQWEAYRRLGEHTVSTFLGRIDPFVPDGEAGTRLRWTLVQALIDLRPRATTAVGTRLRLEQEWQAIETDLARDSETSLLAHQVLGVAAAATPSASANDDVLAGSVRMLRRALNLMEGVCDAFALNQGPAATEAVGWVNRIGRWATTPLFRAWWPWLSPSYSRDLVSYIDQTFPPTDDRAGQGIIRPLGTAPTGHARLRWKAERGAEPDEPNMAGFGYHLPVAELGEVMVALAWVRLDGPADDRSARWRWHDLFIPAGLWGVGIAARFLRQLTEHMRTQHGVQRFRVLAHPDQPPPAALVALCSEPGVSLEPDPARNETP